MANVEDPDFEEAASALRMSMTLLVRRLRQAKAAQGELTLPEASALSRIERDGTTTVTALARIEQISAQSMGATLAALETRGLIRREADPGDGRRAVISVTDTGRQTLRRGRTASAEKFAHALATLSAEELRQLLAVAPLIERLAENI